MNEVRFCPPSIECCCDTHHFDSLSHSLHHTLSHSHSQLSLSLTLTLTLSLNMVKKFSDLSRTGGHAKKILAALDKFLESASGGDADALLEAYLQSRKGKVILEKIIKNFSDEKLAALLERIRVLHENASNNNKAQWLSLVSGIFTQRELIEQYNFKFSKNAFATANRHRQENGAGAPTKKYGRPTKMTDDVKSQVKEFFYSVSYPSSHEVVSKRLKGGGKEVIQFDTWMRVGISSLSLQIVFSDHTYR